MTPTTEPASPRESAEAPRKPRFALFIATACGLGYLKPGPGTWGSLGGLLLTLFPWIVFQVAVRLGGGLGLGGRPDPFLVFQFMAAIGAALVGVWAAHLAAEQAGQIDPQWVVIDEVSGQQLTLLFGGFWPTFSVNPGAMANGHPLSLFQMLGGPNWKYLLAGFILFRVFDIWKPFPVRQAEKLPGGWGIMADDWLAATYAAIGLWIARALGL